MLLVSHHTGVCHERLVEHRKDNIQFGYRCFDRLLLNGLIHPFQQPERVARPAKVTAAARTENR